MTDFGPEYSKIQTIWKRDDRGKVVIGDYSLPELEYLAGNTWRWTEKVDGTNIRLHWDGSKVTIGGRTHNAQVPARLVANLAWLTEPGIWKAAFPDADDVTVYGEGYGAKIQSGGMYRQDQALIVFDVLVGPWWLLSADVTDVAMKLGLEVVPELAPMSLTDAWHALCSDRFDSAWHGARIEGYVGRPGVELFTRKHERLLVKMKVKDYRDAAGGHGARGEPGTGPRRAH